MRRSIFWTGKSKAEVDGFAESGTRLPHLFSAARREAPASPIFPAFSLPWERELLGSGRLV